MKQFEVTRKIRYSSLPNKQFVYFPWSKRGYWACNYAADSIFGDRFAATGEVTVIKIIGLRVTKHANFNANRLGNATFNGSKLRVNVRGMEFLVPLDVAQKYMPELLDFRKADKGGRVNFTFQTKVVARSAPK